MNNLENKEILTEQQLKAIDQIIEKCPDAIFGGSIALNAIGLLNRKVSDIDIFFPYGKSLAPDFLQLDLIDVGSGIVTDENGNEIQRTTANVNAVKCCVFKVDDNSLQHSEMDICGRKLKIQNVNYAIVAKIAY